MKIVQMNGTVAYACLEQVVGANAPPSQAYATTPTKPNVRIFATPKSRAKGRSHYNICGRPLNTKKVTKTEGFDFGYHWRRKRDS